MYNLQKNHRAFPERISWKKIKYLPFIKKFLERGEWSPLSSACRKSIILKMTFIILDKLHLKNRRGRVSRPVLGTRCFLYHKRVFNRLSAVGEPRPYAIGSPRPIRHAKRVVLRGRGNPDPTVTSVSLCAIQPQGEVCR